MSIVFTPDTNLFTLTTAHTACQMGLDPLGHLLHLYYGRRAAGDFRRLYLPRDCGFSPNPYEMREGRGWSLDTLPQEYSGSNTGDYRLPSLELTAESGVCGALLRYVRHEIRPGKYALSGLPAAFDPDAAAETLSVTLSDDAAGVEVELLYGVYEAWDVITRAVRITNTGTGAVRLEKAASLCLDIPFGAWELIHFHGRHTMEMTPERAPLLHGVQSVLSRRGASSHQHNPFVILCEPEATEDAGECYGIMPVYSGSHRTDIELDQAGSVRVVSGINADGFSWTLAPGEVFVTPEVILAFTADGLTALSHIFHRFIPRCLCRSRYALSPRPVLLNSWEAAYFDFDEDRLVRIAEGAAALGAELFVLDDGWFGQRDDDTRALGDWFPHPGKLPGGLSPLIRRVRETGLLFGIWLEPEMVSEDSDLYRAHPDWALRVPGRKPAMSRDQLVLDLSRPEVTDFLYDTISGLLRPHPIAYVKWDMNRSLSDVYSAALPPERQGETAHRYMLGLYGLLDRLTAAFPYVLFEGCAGGGGRFDAGMLAYFPQIWASDNTDPIARLGIQRGLSYGYPPSAVGAHVSSSPNHQTGRHTPLYTRAVTAMAGSFGCELDPAALTEAERAEIRGLIARYRDEIQPLVLTGRYYRLTDTAIYSAWQLVSEGGDAVLVTVVTRSPESNPRPLHLRLKGLDPAAVYTLTRADGGGANADADAAAYTGAALMYAGCTLPPLLGDYPCARLYFRRK